MDSNVDTWGGYLQILSGVSATLLGLAFVAFQLRPQIWAEDPLRRPVAVLALTELGAPLFFSLMVLFPVPLSGPWDWLPDRPGYIVAGWIVGACGYAAILWHLRIYLREEERHAFDRWQMRLDLVPVLTFGVMFFPAGLQWKSAIAVWMCFSGIVEAWLYYSVPSRTTSST